MRADANHGRAAVSRGRGTSLADGIPTIVGVCHLLRVVRALGGERDPSVRVDHYGGAISKYFLTASIYENNT